MKLLEKYETNKERITQHLFFWMMWVVSFTFLQSFGKPSNEMLTWLMYYLLTLPIFVSHTYFVVYFLLPNYLFQRRIFTFILGLLVLSMIFSIAELVVSFEFVFKYFGQVRKRPGDLYTFGSVAVNAIGNSYPVIVFLAVKAAKYLSLSSIRKEEIKKKKVINELNYLKSVQNPELISGLMVELESIAAHSLRDSSQFILRLSDFIRMYFEHARKQQVRFDDEINLLLNYIGLINMGLLNEQRITVSDNIDRKDVSVPALSFFSLAPLIIDQNRETLHFDMSQQDELYIMTATIEQMSGSLGGTAWQNYSNRLRLLFNDKARLSIQKNGEIIAVTLCVEIANTDDHENDYEYPVFRPTGLLN
ncbi:hypothetical protein EYV94_12790 [Puteibacter caeruleilacunae]|nr:hypothetical protein EYV94_12790 [Puteibacter caeruleilacunae]